jgi:hypothetical protein
MFLVLSILSATWNSRNGRMLTGFFIAMATLTRLYPILLLPIVLRRQNWALLLTCFGTILPGYFPFLVLGHGQVFGFFFTYASQQGGNAGYVQLLMQWIGARIGLNLSTIVLLEYGVDVIMVSAVLLAILVLRHSERLSLEMATFIMISTAFAIASHVYPWYVTTLLPWIALLVGPVLWDRATLAQRLLTVMAWYLVCTALLDYNPLVVGLEKAPTWTGWFYANHGLAFQLAVGGGIVLVYGFAGSPVQKSILSRFTPRGSKPTAD